MSCNIFSGGDIKRDMQVNDDIPKRSEQTSDLLAKTCDFCDDETKSWESETELYIHKNKQHQQQVRMLYGAGNKTICRICLKVYESREELGYHIRTAHLLSSKDTRRVEREIFVCDKCNEIFFNKVLLAIHLAKTHSMAVKDDTYECPKCSKRLTFKQIWIHFNRMHEVQSLWLCPICLTKCSSMETLTTHLQVHPKHYHCNMCSSTFQRQIQFQQHIDKHVSDSEEHFINRQFAINLQSVDSYFVPQSVHSAAKRDSVKMHRGLKLFNVKVCVLCREICKKRDMVEHLKCHFMNRAEEKCGFVCCCGQRFDNKILLKQHMFKLQCEKTVENADTTDIGEEVFVVIETVN